MIQPFFYRRRSRTVVAIAVAATIAVVISEPVISEPAPPNFTDLTAPQRVQQESDGLFYLTAEINGALVRFVVDTGASVVVLTPEDARRIGVADRARATGTRIQTAGGSAAMRWTRLGSLRIGRREVRDLDAAIMANGLPTSLLGQNALAKFGSVTIIGDQLHLR